MRGENNNCLCCCLSNHQKEGKEEKLGKRIKQRKMKKEQENVIKMRGENK